MLEGYTDIVRAVTFLAQVKLRGKLKWRANSNLSPSEEKDLLGYVLRMFGAGLPTPG